MFSAFSSATTTDYLAFQRTTFKKLLLPLTRASHAVLFEATQRHLFVELLLDYVRGQSMAVFDKDIEMPTTLRTF